VIPDNGRFFVAAYVLAAVLYTGYALSLWARSRRLDERLRDRDTRDLR
jgi:hypothetical protein